MYLQLYAIVALRCGKKEERRREEGGKKEGRRLEEGGKKVGRRRGMRGSVNLTFKKKEKRRKAHRLSSYILCPPKGEAAV